ncbi:unnamed protein product, partial [Owenia fusiformis]
KNQNIKMSQKMLSHSIRGLLSVGTQSKGALNRPLFGWLNSVFNRMDKDRVKEVGPERACAEWLIRCGAHVKWKGAKRWHADYNTLPQSSSNKYVIEEVNGDNAAVMGIGFPHFVGCNHVRKIRFHFCGYMHDDAIQQLDILKETLEHLEITSCANVTDKGLFSLTNLNSLQTLIMYDLPSVRDKKGSLDLLRHGLPKCHIEFHDVEKPENPAISMGGTDAKT